MTSRRRRRICGGAGRCGSSFAASPTTICCGCRCPGRRSCCPAARCAADPGPAAPTVLTRSRSPARAAAENVRVDGEPGQERLGRPLAGRTVPDLVSQLVWRVHGPLPTWVRPVSDYLALAGLPAQTALGVAARHGLSFGCCGSGSGTSPRREPPNPSTWSCATRSAGPPPGRRTTGPGCGSPACWTCRHRRRRPVSARRRSSAAATPATTPARCDLRRHARRRRILDHR